MRIVDLIAIKRDGGELSKEQIEWFIRSYTAGQIPDYQASALMMATYIQGMNRRETIDLTFAIAASGEQLDLHDVAPFVIDKHSSGGVGDKTTLVVQPIVAACGVPVGKMSGRGLGSSGGTLDKMESFSGWSSDMTLAQFKAQLADIGLVLAGQTADLAPADGKLYALRDVTGTVANGSLIAASIMSKKLAAGADGIVLDVKVGNGAFMPTVAAAKELAQIMVEIGQGAGRKMVVLLSDMNQPLGEAVGNILEVKEAIATLQGQGPTDFWIHCRTVAAHMLWLAGKVTTVVEGEEMATAVCQNGQALAKFRQLVVAQGGTGKEVDDMTLLGEAAYIAPVPAPRSGFVTGMNTGEIGWVCVRLGGGRFVKSDQLDHQVGIIWPLKVGDAVQVGESLGFVHANDPVKLEQALTQLPATITWSDEPVAPLPHFYGAVT